MPLTDVAASFLISARSAVVSLTLASMLSALPFSADARSLSCVMVVPTLVLRWSMAFLTASGSFSFALSASSES